MRIYLTLLFVLFACSTSRKLGFFSEGERNAAKEGYRLVWSDEFNTDGLPNAANWNFEKGFVRNNEHQWYQPQNAWCQNGVLVIEGKRETGPNPLYEEGSQDWRKSRKQLEYTSSSLLTSGKQSWQYGRFVMRGKIDISAGIWPAWWTLGVRGRWPASPQIYIMKYYRGKVLANIAYMGKNGRDAWYANTFPVDSMGGQQWASQFHVWRMDWDEKAIALYVDDQLLNRVELNKLVNQDGTDINPFRQPHYMLLNLAIGGTNGGDPSSTTFPKRFEVDYVRVYQKKK